MFAGRSSSDMTTSTDPSSSEQSCDTVIYNGPRDDDGTDCESPPVFLPSLNSGDHRGVMSRVLKGSTAELPPTKYRSLDRKSQRSPMSGPLLATGGCVRSPSSSQHSTPVKTVSGVRSPSNTGSLPRSTRPGKMPLFGKVAGYRQPPGHETGLNPRLSITSGRSRLSDTSQHQPAEIWVDSKPICDKELLSSGGSPLPAQYDTSAIYGYMDEHKKQMIQQWVEGQSMGQCLQSQVPPSHLTGRDSLAWLQAHSEAQQQQQQQQQQSSGQYRCLTQFKMVESSTSDVSDPPDPDGDPPPLNHDPPEAEMKTRLESRDSETSARTDLDKPDKITPTSDQGRGAENSATCQHEMENKCSGGEVGKSLESAAKLPDKSTSYRSDTLRSITSKSSTNSSKKSDVGTNTENNNINMAKQQDPFGSSRKLTLRRTSGAVSSERRNVDEMSGIRTLDELYNHCEQLVETLSQASEELRAQSHQSENNGIDDIEIYEVSEGSEVSVEVRTS